MAAVLAEENNLSSRENGKAHDLKNHEEESEFELEDRHRSEKHGKSSRKHKHSKHSKSKKKHRRSKHRSRSGSRSLSRSRSKSPEKIKNNESKETKGEVYGPAVPIETQKKEINERISPSKSIASSKSNCKSPAIESKDESKRSRSRSRSFSWPPRDRKFKSRSASPAAKAGDTEATHRSRSNSQSRNKEERLKSRSKSKSKSPAKDGKYPKDVFKSRSESTKTRTSRSRSRSESAEKKTPHSKSRSRRSRSTSRSRSDKKKSRSRSRSRSISRSPKRKKRSPHRDKSQSKSKSRSPKRSRRKSSSPRNRKSRRSKSPRSSRRSKSPRPSRRSKSPRSSRRSRSPKSSRRSRSPKSSRRSKSPKSFRRSRSPQGRFNRRGRSKSRSPKRGRDRSRSRSLRRRRSRSRSRSPRRTRNRSRSRSPRRRRHPSRSRSPRRRKRSRTRSPRRRGHSRSKSRSPRRRRDRSRSRSHDKSRRSRSKSKEDDLSKYMIDSTDKPIAGESSVPVKPVTEIVGSAPKVSGGTAGGRSIAELTAFCKKLTEARGIASADSPVGNKANSGEDDGDDSPVISHPFLVKAKPDITIPSVIFPVRQLPPTVDPSKPLTEQFPVSCGSKHHEKENDDTVEAHVEGVDGAVENPTQVFEQPTTQQEKLDISGLVVKRMEAQRRLQTNPHDLDAMLVEQEVTMKMQNWAQSNVKPGQFTGQMAKTMMPKQQLHTGFQAWAKKDMFHNLTPVTGGIGMKLMQKMGWQPGSAIGKSGEGIVEPIALTVKSDRRGLSSGGEKHPGKKGAGRQPPGGDMQGMPGNKHPISMLQEICSRKKWGLPDFQLIFDHGPPHSKQFLFKVIVNGYAYQPQIASGNKKHAKAQCALYALKALGVMPHDATI